MLIFDRFPNRERAEAFAKSIAETDGLVTSIHETQDESNAIDPFPFKLTPPIVLAERKWIEPEGWDGDHERKIESSVREFGGVFAGT